MYQNDYQVTVPQFANRTVSIREYGAKNADLSIEAGRNNAKAINKAIVEVSAQGGGTVIIPAGIWACVPIRLQSGVNLRLEGQAVLKFIKSNEDYPLIVTDYEGLPCIRAVSPVSAEHAERIAITGEGIIDGGGDEWRPVKRFKATDPQWNTLLKKSPYVFKTKETEIWVPSQSSFEGNQKKIQGSAEEIRKQAEPYYDYYRPVMVSLRHCSQVLLQGVVFRNSPAWNVHPYFCDSVTVDHVSIENPYYAQNGDGIDVESCTNVHIHHSTFRTGDDAICIKAGKNAEARKTKGPCRNLWIHDCTVYEGHGGFVIGSEMSRGVSDILAEDCTFIGTDVGIRMKSALGRGGVVENITIRRINMMDIKGEAVLLTMGYQLNAADKRDPEDACEEDIPYFRNMDMEQICCIGCGKFVSIEPIAGKPETIQNIRLNGEQLC